MSGDIPDPELRAALHRAADIIANYLEQVGEYPVRPQVEPGEVRDALASEPPVEGESLESILDDYERLIEPNTTHWNHPGFMAYFAISGSGPGILGESLAAALNVNAMLWRTSPVGTELENLTCDWLRGMLGLSQGWTGHINDTASVSTLLSLAAARQRLPGLDIRKKGLAGRPDLAPLVTYASDQAHSSCDKAVLTLGQGLENLRRVESDDFFRLDPARLSAAIEDDRSRGRRPMAVVATAGTTSTTSVDPIREIAEICSREGLWLHVDAAYAGGAAICKEYRKHFEGWDGADSIVVNPHKWLFTPMDCSVLFVRDLAHFKSTFSIVPDYLKTTEVGVTNLMDLGIQLGRRFRALKLWMVMRAFGVEGLQARIRDHCQLATELAEKMDSHPDFELVAPVPFSVVCFRWKVGGSLQDQNKLNETLLEEINCQGPFFLSGTVLRDRYTLRCAIGNLRTTREHVNLLWELVQTTADRLSG